MKAFRSCIPSVALMKQFASVQSGPGTSSELSGRGKDGELTGGAHREWWVQDDLKDQTNISFHFNCKTCDPVLLDLRVHHTTDDLEIG